MPLHLCLTIQPSTPTTNTKPISKHRAGAQHTARQAFSVPGQPPTPNGLQMLQYIVLSQGCLLCKAVHTTGVAQFTVNLTQQAYHPQHVDVHSSTAWALPRTHKSLQSAIIQEDSPFTLLQRLRVLG